MKRDSKDDFIDTQKELKTPIVLLIWPQYV